mmetsp:Transcript_1345/g.4150  ORF Transcript_1345/g.4150 Transcript_1345/m.4150 type:complete len:362 (+) Transcript_1345:1-1086(+)
MGMPPPVDVSFISPSSRLSTQHTSEQRPERSVVPRGRAIGRASPPLRCRHDPRALAVPPPPSAAATTPPTRPTPPPPAASASASADGDAAVDVDAVAGDVVGGRVEGEELDEPGHLLGLPKPARGDAFHDLGDDLLVEHVSHVGRDEAGRHGVAGHAARRQLLGHRHSHRDDASLCRRVVCLARVANLADDGGDVDDAPLARLAHGLGRRLRGVKDAVQVGVDDVLPLLLLHAQDERVARDARVVHEHTHRIVERIRGGLEQRVDPFGRRHVCLHRHAVAAEPLDLLHHRLGSRRGGGVVDHHAAPLFAQAECDGAAEAAGAAGDDADRAIGRHLDRAARREALMRGEAAGAAERQRGGRR